MRDAGVSGWTSLPEPRRPSPAERAVIDRLVAHTGSAELTAQAASVSVVATCDCGCPSVLLHSDAPPLSAAAMAGLSSTGRTDWFSVDHTRVDESAGPDPSTGDTAMFQVVLHVTQGSLHSLEVFAGEGVAVDLPSPPTLDPLTLM